MCIYYLLKACNQYLSKRFNFLLLFLGFGVAKWISDSLNDEKVGYFIVGGFYLLLIVLIVALRKKLIIPYFRNTIIKKLYEK